MKYSLRLTKTAYADDFYGIPVVSSVFIMEDTFSPIRLISKKVMNDRFFAYTISLTIVYDSIDRYYMFS